MIYIVLLSPFSLNSSAILVVHCAQATSDYASSQHPCLRLFGHPRISDGLRNRNTTVSETRLPGRSPGAALYGLQPSLT